MTTKPIAEMIAELPPKGDEWLTLSVRLNAEVALLRAALEGVLRITNHVYECPAAYGRGRACTCGYDDANKVLEVTK